MEEARPYTSEIKQVHNVHVHNMPDVQKDVTEFIMEHLNDPNFDLTQRPYSVVESTNTNVGEDSSSAINVDDESPYPEVRASVSNFDDPLMSVNTFRMWFLGISLSLITSGLNQVFSMRYPFIFVSTVIPQIVAFPLGRGLAAILPKKHFNTFGYAWSFNPGPFSIKEHVCITVMISVSGSGRSLNDVILMQHVVYGQTTPMRFQILLVIASQCIGFCFAGLFRQLLVWPSSMIWPGVLPNCAFFNTLHKNYTKGNQGHMPRERLFSIVIAAGFIWYWVPGYLFTALSMFNWVCWIAPNNIVINTMFGTKTGLGMSIFTFDWAMISSFTNPLITPGWAQMNIAVSFILMFWLIAPILYFTNVWNSAYVPISGRTLFDNTGAPYNGQRVITDGIFDPVKYAEYSPIFTPITITLTTGAAFASFPATFVHMFLWYRKDIYRRFRNSLKDEHDIHSHLMQNYPEVPMWWYGIIGIISFSFLCVAIKIIPIQLPIWATIIAILLSFIFAVPSSMIYAITNLVIDSPVIYELIAGYIVPGRPIANSIFKTLVSGTTLQTTCSVAGLKLGHYMKVPPRIMFTIQIIPIVVIWIWVTFIQHWMLNNVEDICLPGQKHGFICPGTRAINSASIAFGGVGPQRLFGPGAPYSALLWFFPIGFLSPIPFYLLARRFPFSIWRYINVPGAFSMLLYMPLVSGINYSSWIICGFIFNYVIRRFHFRWWMRYNYIFAVALDAGTAISAVLIFFTLILPKAGFNLNWWGNTVWQKTADATGIPFKPIPESGFFGPTKWS